MLNRKKTPPDTVQALASASRKALTASLAFFLCVLATPSQAQQYRQYNPDVEINTSVLNELSRQMEANRKGNSAPVKLKRPAPPSYNSTYEQQPVLTGRGMEQSPENRYDHIIMPRSATTQNLQGAAPAQAQIPPHIADDEYKILPKTKLQAVIDDPPIPPRKTNERQQKIAISAPLPPRKPIKAIEMVKAEAIKSIPIPQKRPALQKASRSFVAEKRANDPFGRANARITNKNAPNLLSTAQKTMPSAPAGPVIAEPLTGTQAVQHKRKIIDAVQQIARANKEPEIDITAASLQQHTNKQITAQDITAAPPRIQDIEPAAGRTTPAKVAAYSTNKGEVVRIPFPSQESKIDSAIKGAINAHILPSLQATPDRRIQLQSYASQKQNRSNLNARRISLSRALAVRQYLITMGIEAKRIDIMPLGDKSDEKQEDRIDFLIFSPNAS